MDYQDELPMISDEDLDAVSGGDAIGDISAATDQYFKAVATSIDTLLKPVIRWFV